MQKVKEIKVGAVRTLQPAGSAERWEKRERASQDAASERS